MDFDLNWVGSADGRSDERGVGPCATGLGQGPNRRPQTGAGRVLGLASVAALPRRLALDFSDLTDKGLAFDTVRGDFDLRDGNAYTENVLVKGPAAEIGLIGRVAEKQGLRPNCSGNGQLRQLSPASGGLRGWPCAGGARCWFSPKCSTASEGTGTRVLSNYGQLGQSHCGKNQKCRRGRRGLPRLRNNGQSCRHSNDLGSHRRRQPGCGRGGYCARPRRRERILRAYRRISPSSVCVTPTNSRWPNPTARAPCKGSERYRAGTENVGFWAAPS